MVLVVFRVVLLQRRGVDWGGGGRGWGWAFIRKRRLFQIPRYLGEHLLEVGVY